MTVFQIQKPYKDLHREAPSTQTKPLNQLTGEDHAQLTTAARELTARIQAIELQWASRSHSVAAGRASKGCQKKPLGL